jgi:putative hydrolases of HD superfamily
MATPPPSREEGANANADTNAAAPPPLLPARAAVDFALLLGALKRTPRTGWVRSGVPATVAESISDHSHRLSTLALVAAFSGGVGGGGGEGGGGASALPPLDVSRCVRMAVVHDIAEALVGDITPHCGVSEEEKHRREAAAMERIAALLSGLGGGGGARGGEGEGDNHNHSPPPLPDASLSAAARDVRDLWREYEAGVTQEARLIKDLDRLEMLVQALEYEEQGAVVGGGGGGRAGGGEGGGGGKGGAAADGWRPLQSFFDGCRGKWRTPLGEAWAAEIERRRGAGGGGAGGGGD